MSSTLEQEISYLKGKVRKLTKLNAELRRELEQKNKSITVYKDYSG